MQLISAILYDTVKFMVAALLGKTYDLRCQNGAMVRVTLLSIRKPRAVDNMVSMFWG